MTTTVYQFGTTSDPQSVWTNEANLVDNNDGTAATCSTLQGAASAGANNQVQLSALASLAGTGFIGAVRMRLFGSTTAGNPKFQYYVKVGSTEILNQVITLAGAGQLVNLPAPTSAGWQWSDLEDLTVYIGLQSSGGGNALETVEISVQTFAYRWPIMVGIGTSLPVGTDRATPINGSPDSTWSTTTKTGETCAPCDLAFQRLYVGLSAAPGAGGPEAFSLWSHASPQLGTTLITKTVGSGDTAVADDGTATVSLAPGETARIDRTLGSPVTNASTPTKLLTYVCADTFPLFASTSGNVGVNATVYVALQDSSANTATTARGYPMPVAGTISDLYVKKLEAALSSGTYTITLQKNGVDTALTVTIGAGETVDSDTTNSVTVAVGDVMGWKIVGASASATSAFAIGACFDSDDPGLGLILGGNVTAIGNVTTHNNWYGVGAWDATEGNRQAYAGHCEVTAMYVLLGTAPAASPGAGRSRTFTLRKGGADTSMSVTITDTATTGSASGSVLLEDLDLVNIRHVPTNTPANSAGRYGLAYRSPVYEKTFDDGLAITDTADPATDYIRTPDDPLAITDDHTAELGEPPATDHERVVDDPLTLTDNPFYNPRRLSDTLQLTDEGSVEVADLETGALTDEVLVEQTIIRTPADDPLTLTDTLTYTLRILPVLATVTADPQWTATLVASTAGATVTADPTMTAEVT